MKLFYAVVAVGASIVCLDTGSETALFMAVLAGLALVQKTLTGE